MQWNYRSQRDLPAVNYSAGISRDRDGRAQATGGLAYNGYRAEGSLRHDITARPDGDALESRSQILLGSAIVVADGQVALSRPVSGSFVVLPRHDNLSRRRIGINPSSVSEGEDGNFQARIDGLGPAVIPDSTPYMYRPVRIDTQSLPAGYDIGRDVYTVFPSYKSGTLLPVGNAENIFADGYLLHGDGRAVSLQGGVIVRQDNGAAQEFFTNAEGRFRVSRLAPGDYRMTLHRNAETAALRVPDIGIGRYDAGKVSLTEEKE